MAIEKLKEHLPEYAKDLKLNLSSIISTPEGMTEQQLWGSLLAAAIASRNPEVLAEIHEDAATHLTEGALRGVKAAGAIMGMNNIYYRFLHLVPNKEYGTMPARLRMNVMMNPGVDKVDFELWSLVVSTINACGACIAAHEKELIDKGMGKPAIQHAVRIASVIHAIAGVLDAEKAMQTPVA
ncbi:MAG: alkyl hydroperoxide reductase AhpD [Candidatus Hydrogenedentota bacterium]